VCNSSAASLLACDVRVLATLVMDNAGVDSATSGTFAGQLLNAGEPMSCGGRTVRSFTAEAVVCLHTVVDSKADCGLPCAWEAPRYGLPQLLLLRVHSKTGSIRRSPLPSSNHSLWSGIHSLADRSSFAPANACEHVSMMKLFLPPLIRCLRLFSKETKGNCEFLWSWRCRQSRW
jgi:hypothetical protein